MKLLFTSIFFFITLVLVGQKNLKINITTDYTNIIKNDANYIETLKFYLTNFSLLKSGKVIWNEKNSYHLIDFSDDNSLSFELNKTSNLTFDEIVFSFGTDSLTNVSGAMGGDLDPTKGMYWTWNSGYINFKLEGKKDSTSFEFHLGGYNPPFQTIQKISLKTSSGKSINLNLNILEFLNQLDITNQNKILSPGKEAQRLSLILASLFLLK